MVQPHHSELPAASQLLALASEKSSEKRLELLRRMVDTFSFDTNGSTRTAQYLLDEIVSKLLDQIESRDRAAAASSLAKMKQLPENVARSLAHDDDIAVARPIIRDYRSLSSAILLDLASKGSQPHLEAIAQRDVLGPDVTDIVVRRGNGQIIRTLASNHGAQFSRFGMRTMIDRATTDQRLQELLVDRTDLSLEAVGQLLPIVSERLAAQLRSADLAFSPSLVQEQVVSWVSDRKKSIEQVNRSIERIKAGSEKLDNVLTSLAAERRMLDVAAVVAGVSELDRDYCFNLVTQAKTDTVVVLLRSLSVDWGAAEGVLKLRIDKLGSQLCGPMIDEATYASVDMAGAQRVIRFLKVRRAALASEAGAIAS